MTASCDELEGLLRDLGDRIVALEMGLSGKLDRSERGGIVVEAKQQTIAVLGPEINYAIQLGMIAAAAIATLKAKQIALSAAVAAFGAMAQNALAAIGGVLAKIASLAATVAALAASVATLLVLGNRIDQLETRVDSIEGGVGMAISIASAAKNAAQSAKKIAEEAAAGAARAFAAAQNADANAAKAMKAADAASALAGQSLSTANAVKSELPSMNKRIDAASATAGQALSTANAVKSELPSMNKRIDAASATAGQALSTAQATQAEIPGIKKRTDEAIATATGAKAIAQNAINIANEALRAKAQPGPRGATGARGPMGLTGQAGKEGAPGRDGAPGRPGIKGKDGKDGINFGGADNARIKAIETAIATLRATTTTIINNVKVTNNVDVTRLEKKIDATPAITSGIILAGLTPTLKNIQADQGKLAQGMNAIQTNLNDLKNNMEKSFKKVMGGIDFMKIIDVLTLITSFHNALMLSRSIGETLIQVIENGLQMFGIKATENGEDLTVSKVLGRKFEDAMKATFGATQWAQIVATWKGLNNIYTSAANIAWNIRAMFDSGLSIMSWTAENTGKIGNALKRFGVVGEKAYGRMPEQVTAMNAFQQRLENLEDAASGLEMVSSEVLSVQQNLNELKEQREKFEKSIVEFPPLNRPDNQPVAAREAAEKAASVGATITPEAFDPDPED